MQTQNATLTVRHQQTRETGTVRSIWWNEYAGAYIVNVRLCQSNQMASWNVAQVKAVAS